MGAGRIGAATGSLPEPGLSAAGMGEERWRRQLRSGAGVVVPLCLAPFFVVWTFAPSLPVPLRVLAGLLAVVSVAAAVDAFGATIVVGSDGISVRRTLMRRSLTWDEVDGFAAERRGMSGKQLVIRAVPRNGRAFPVTDSALPAAEGQQLLVELGKELELHR